jgi:hypothetical protein
VKLERLKSLNEEEMNMLLYILNTTSPRLLPYEVTKDVIPYLKNRYLEFVIKSIEPKIAEDGKHIFSCLKEKLQIQ